MQDIDWPLQMLSAVMLGLSLYAQKLIGDKRVAGQWLGLGNQILWVTFALWVRSYPTLVSAALYGVVYYRNARKWMR